MKKYYFLFVLGLVAQLNIGQTTYSWRNESTDGNWSTSGNWYDGSSTTNVPNGGEIISFGNNANLTMTNDLSATNRFKILFTSNASSARTISGATENTFYNYSGTWPFIKNESTTTHTIGFPIKAGYDHLELVAQAGPIHISGNIDNDGHTVHIYGDGSVIDVTSRYIYLSGILSGSGNLNITNYAMLKLDAVNTYTGETQIDNGELWIDEGGNIDAGSSIYVGNGGMTDKVAKLFLSDADGGSNFTNNITINTGNVQTRFVGSLNTSGVNTFSGNITSNATDLYLQTVYAGGTTNFTGEISEGASTTTYVHKIGAGKTILSNDNNDYTGSTIIEEGTLEQGIESGFAYGTDVVLKGGTLSTGGFSAMLNTLTLDNDATIKLGTGSHNLSFEDSHNTTWTSGKTLTIDGWGTGTEGTISIGSDNTGLTSSQLAQIHFTGYPAGAFITSDGEIVPVYHNSDADEIGVTQPGSALLNSIDESIPANAYNVLKFNITDYGGDNLPTKVTNIRLVPASSNTADWTDNIGGVILKTAAAGEITINTPVIDDAYIDIPIPSGNLSISDNGYEEIQIFVYLNSSNLEDGKRLKFKVSKIDHGFTTVTSGTSLFAAEFDDDIVSNNFTIQVTATELQFTQQPSNVEIGVVMSPDVIVSATDANGNIDIDFDGIDGTVQLSVSGSTFNAGATDTVDAVNGVASFDNLIFDSTGSGVTLTTSNAESLTDATSNQFNVNLPAENCSQLFISEYGNISGGNYVEIYNPTGSDVDLSDYQLRRGTNGGSWASADIFTMSATLPSGDVYTFAKTGEIPSADQHEDRMNYNGDDNIGLFYNDGNGFVLIDAVGDDQGDPGTGWTVAGVTNATYNRTLIRKKTVQKPNTNWALSAGTDATDSEWIVSSYTQANLFFHHSNCNYYPCTAMEETAILIDFDNNDTGWTTSASGNDTEYVYFDKVKLDYSGNNSDEVGSAVELYKGSALTTDYFFGAQDTDESPVNDSSPEFYINNVNISDLKNLKFSISIAEDDQASGGWDTDTSMHIFYKIDNTGPFKKLLWVESTSSSNNNKPAAVDVDFNGIGNLSYTITDHFKEFSKDIKETGTEIDIKIVFSYLNNATEDIAIDDIKITGDRIPTSTYASGSWDATPDIGRKVIFDDDYNTSSGNVSACSCMVKANKTLTISDNTYVEVAGSVDNDGTIIVENKGALMQYDAKGHISGSGTFQLNKTSLDVDEETDYVYWSSPLNSTTFTLGDIVSGAWRYYEFDLTQTNPGWHQLAAGDNPAKGMGYAISAPSGTSATTQLTANFVKDHDPFNNGDITVNIYKKGAAAGDPENYNLLGNPYPSAIDFDALVTDNPDVEGSYYLWTNCAGLDTNGHHQEAGYTVYVKSGTATAACNNSSNPTAGRYIATGQGFFIGAVNDNSTLTFKNTHRVTGNNDNFANRSINRNIAWVDMTDANGKFSQIAVGFYPDATDAYDRNFDAHSMNTGSGFALYSLLNNSKLAIQGLPEWNDTDKVVPLGVESGAGNSITFHLNRTEGLSGIHIYLRDLDLGITHELTATDYTTAVSAGNIDSRFELLFTPNLLGEQQLIIDPNTVLLIQNNSLFSLQAQEDHNITGLTVYDLSGRVLFEKQNLHTTGYQVNLKQVATGNLLLFRVQIDGNSYLVKKTIKK